VITMIHKNLGFALILIICLFLSGAASAATIQTTGVSISGPGQKADIPVTIDAVAQGLAGYKMVVGFSEPGIAQISAVTFPEWASLKNIDGTLPAEAATLTAVDLMDSIKAGATTVPVVTFSIEGVAAGTTTLVLTINELTDDSGNPVQFTQTPAGITVGGSGTTPVGTATPTPTPTSSVIPPPAETTPTQTPIPEITPSGPIVPMVTPTPVPTVSANFTADITSGTAPMTVSFTDLSDGYPDKFIWNFGDSSSDYSSVVQNPQHTYKIPGVYSVSMNASNSQYSDSLTKENYIIVASVQKPARGEVTKMQIFSVPDGAECYLNNVYYGLTPVIITNLSPRIYQLRLHKEGYYDVVDPVFANEGVLPTYVSGYEMVPHYAEIGKLVADPPQTGAAYIVTYPELITAFIDDKKVGKTDIMVMNLAVGTHNLTLVKDGYANWTDTLDIRNGLGVIQTYTYEKPYFPPQKTVGYVDMKP
jgi:PKD repeat protein